MSPLFRRENKLISSIDQLDDLIAKREESQSKWQSAIRAVYQKIDGASTDEIKQTQQRLADMIRKTPLMLASILAVTSGAFIEKGADPDIPAEAVFQRMIEALKLATDFGNACLEKAKEQHTRGGSGDESDMVDYENNMLNVEECVEEQGKALAESMMKEALGWQALETFTMAALAIATRSAQQRNRVRADAEFMSALQQCPAESTLQNLRIALNLLENEEIIVLHPEQQRGYRIRINNIGINFELHTLLAGALIGDPAQGWLAGKKPDPRVVAAAKDSPFPAPGEPHYEQFPKAEGAFNLWNWQGLQPDGRLPDVHFQNGRAYSKYWIWNEGQPADIEPFEGTRVILLGPPPYNRSWNAGRFFRHINAELEVLEQLPEQQVKEWLTRIATAVQAEHHQGMSSGE